MKNKSKSISPDNNFTYGAFLGIDDISNSGKAGYFWNTKVFCWLYFYLNKNVCELYCGFTW